MNTTKFFDEGKEVSQVEWAAKYGPTPAPGYTHFAGQIFGPTNEGVKNDTGKRRYDLLSPYANEGLVDVLTFGSKKYGDRNWEQGMGWGRVFGACMRHLWAFWRGENSDGETGLSHLDHAAACIHFLSHYSKRQVGTDDRPPVKIMISPYEYIYK